jgi:hypothetical protein
MTLARLTGIPRYSSSGRRPGLHAPAVGYLHSGDTDSACAFRELCTNSADARHQVPDFPGQAKRNTPIRSFSFLTSSSECADESW